jgi:hypothetical protein
MLPLDKDNTWVRRDLVACAVGDPAVDGKVQIGTRAVSRVEIYHNTGREDD